MLPALLRSSYLSLAHLRCFSSACRSINLSAALVKADQDKDGSLNQEELSAALKHLAGAVDTEDAAAALIRRLDSDRDGEITVESLERFLDRYAERLAKAEARAAEDDSGAPPPPGATPVKLPKVGSRQHAAGVDVVPSRGGKDGSSGNESDGSLSDLGSGSDSESEGDKQRTARVRT